MYIAITNSISPFVKLVKLKILEKKINREHYLTVNGLRGSEISPLDREKRGICAD